MQAYLEYLNFEMFFEKKKIMNFIRTRTVNGGSLTKINRQVNESLNINITLYVCICYNK